MAENARFTMYRGDTKILKVAVTDGSGANVAIDDAESVTFGLFALTSHELIFVKTLAFGITVAGHVITIAILASDSAGLTGDYLFEVELVDAGGFTYTVLRGTAIVKEDLITSDTRASAMGAEARGKVEIAL
jgi:hypothetical protein